MQSWSEPPRQGSAALSLLWKGVQTVIGCLLYAGLEETVWPSLQHACPSPQALATAQQQCVVLQQRSAELEAEAAALAKAHTEEQAGLKAVQQEALAQLRAQHAESLKQASMARKAIEVCSSQHAVQLSMLCK